MLKKSILFGALCVFAVSSSPASAEFTDEQFGKMFEKFAQSDKGRDTIGGAAKAFLMQEQEKMKQAAKQAELSQLEEQFKNPVQMPVGDSPTRGPQDAKVTIVEFSDFQCPFCQRGANTMEAVTKKFPKDVKIVFKHLPLEFHPNAMPAAKAAAAAGKQGKFWEMHDKFFADQKSLSPDFYIQTAKDLGLNIDKFQADMNDPAIEKSIKDDMELAKKNGIQGTPGFFVNGVAVKGAYPIDHFEGIINRWLTGKPAAAAAPAAVNKG